MNSAPFEKRSITESESELIGCFKDSSIEFSCNDFPIEEQESLCIFVYDKDKDIIDCIVPEDILFRFGKTMSLWFRSEEEAREAINNIRSKNPLDNYGELCQNLLRTSK